MNYVFFTPPPHTHTHTHTHTHIHTNTAKNVLLSCFMSGAAQGDGWVCSLSPLTLLCCAHLATGLCQVVMKYRVVCSFSLHAHICLYTCMKKSVCIAVVNHSESFKRPKPLCGGGKEIERLFVSIWKISWVEMCLVSRRNTEEHALVPHAELTCVLSTGRNVVTMYSQDLKELFNGLHALLTLSFKQKETPGFKQPENIFLPPLNPVWLTGCQSKLWKHELKIQGDNNYFEQVQL